MLLAVPGTQWLPWGGGKPLTLNFKQLVRRVCLVAAICTLVRAGLLHHHTDQEALRRSLSTLESTYPISTSLAKFLISHRTLQS